MRKLFSVLIPVIIILGVFSVIPSHSATNAFQYDVTFSGISPGATTPYLRATFDDSYGGSNTVRLTVDILNLDATSSATKLYFNFDPSLNANLLTFTPVYTADSSPNSVQGANNSFMADGDGNYDIWFDMPPPPGNFSARLTNGEQLVYDLTYTSAIDVSSFNYFSTTGGGQGTYLAAAHIQGIGDGSNSSSGWVGVVPEPVSSTLFIIGAGVLGFRRFRKKRTA